MQQIQPKKISTIWSDARAYFNTRLEYFRLKAIGKTTKIMGDVLSSFLLLFFVSAAFITGAITIAFHL